MLQMVAAKVMYINELFQIIKVSLYSFSIDINLIFCGKDILYFFLRERMIGVGISP